jgi:hypothetical protein
MRARVPLDVDLEDRLLYGLTPVRLGYLVLSLLAAIAVWSSAWMPIYVRVPVSLLAVTGGGLLAWGRWRGRAADSWALDLLRFVVWSRRIVWKWRS